jgi:hypothetical protein
MSDVNPIRYCYGTVHLHGQARRPVRVLQLVYPQQPLLFKNPQIIQKNHKWQK